MATHLSVTAPLMAVAGTEFQITVKALDASNNPVSSYAGTVHFSSTDGRTVLPEDSKLTNGSGTFSATLRTAGSTTITATDTVSASITGTSSSIDVSAGPATHFSISAPPTTQSGTAFDLTVTALDAGNNVAKSYTGTVHFTSTDSHAVLPVNSTFTSGTGSFSATLETVGSQTITTTDTVRASISGTSNSIDVSATSAVNPVPFINQPLSPDAAAPGGAAFQLAVNGTGFVSDSVVNWNGSPLTTTFVSGSQLTASISASAIATAGTASVTVVNPAPGGGSSNVVFFPVAAPIASPALTGTAFPAGTGPRSIATGDFNGDGKLDLVVPDAISGTVTILLGNGDGTFKAGASYTVGRGSSHQFFNVTVADLNGDGKLDFVVANFNGNNVSVFLGNGDGTFQAGVNYDVGTNPTSVAVADLKRDGKLDLAVSNQNCNGGTTSCTTGTISILLGNGDGTFAAHVDYAAGTDPNWVTVGDFNGDGKLDLAVANGQGACPGCQSAFTILLGNGDGTFQAPATNSGGVNPASIATADLNGDGKLDLILVDNIGAFYVFLGNGDGTFQTTNAVGYFTDSFPWGSIGIGDFNGDGKLDVVIANSGSNDVEIFPGNGDGTFQSTPFHFSTGSDPQGAAIGDFNQDGRLDIAVASYKDNTATILLQ
jgi:hypothetical protein